MKGLLKISVPSRKKQRIIEHKKEKRIECNQCWKVHCVDLYFYLKKNLNIFYTSPTNEHNSQTAHALWMQSKRFLSQIQGLSSTLTALFSVSLKQTEQQHEAGGWALCRKRATSSRGCLAQLLFCPAKWTGFCPVTIDDLENYYENYVLVHKLNFTTLLRKVMKEKQSNKVARIFLLFINLGWTSETHAPRDEQKYHSFFYFT